MNLQNLLPGKVVIITGAASGIGMAAAFRFADNGASVLVADVDEEKGEEVAALLRSSGHRALFARTDVASAESTRAMAETALREWGAIDILYNNAATTVLCNEMDRAVHELEEWVWDKMLAVCLKGVYLASKAVLPNMMKRKSGVILNTASVNGLVAEPGFDSYTAAKGGVIALTRSMATEYAPYNIRVNSISPGYVITECQKGWYENDSVAREKAHAMHLTRIGKPDDIANMAVYLSSDLAEFITGANIPVDGGFTAFKGEAAFRNNT